MNVQNNSDTEDENKRLSKIEEDVKYFPLIN